MDKEIIRAKVEEINSLHKEVDTRFRAAVNDIKDRVFRIGELLTECKKEYGTHGLWMAWVEANCEFSYFTANNYINAYERRNNPNFELVKNLKDIYYPQIEHKPEVKEPPKGKLSEPVVTKPVVKEPVVTVPIEEEPEEPEVVEPEAEIDDQDGMLEDLKHGFMRLDKSHKNKFLDWLEETIEDLVEREAA